MISSKIYEVRFPNSIRRLTKFTPLKPTKQELKEMEQKIAVALNKIKLTTIKQNTRDKDELNNSSGETEDEMEYELTSNNEPDGDQQEEDDDLQYQL